MQRKLYRSLMKSGLRISQVLIFLLPLCLVAFVPAPLRAQTPSARATVDATRTSLESPIRLTVTITGEDGSVDTSVIRDFKLLGQASSSSIQIINGRVNRERTMTYTLLPLKEGRLTIPALNVTVDGEKCLTEPIVVQVSKGSGKVETSNDISVSGTVDENHPFLGQQVVYTFRLLYGVQLANTDYEAPSFEGFSATQIGNQTTGQRLINGRQFQEVTISYLLVPMKTGTLTIGPAMLQCNVVYSRRNSRSMFDSFFDDSFFGNSQVVPKVFRTEPVPIDVAPLPKWKGPEIVSGLVGQFKMQAELETLEAAVGESVTLSVTLQGEGNLQDAEKPQFQISSDFKQYEDQPETDITLGSNGYAGKKVFRTALVPVKEGNYTLTAVPMVYFDPVDKTYHRLTTKPLSIVVHDTGKKTEPPSVFSALDAKGTLPAFQKQKVDFTGRDILPIKTGLDALSNQTSIPTPLYLSLLAAPGVVFLIIFITMNLVKKDDRPAAVMTRKSKQALHAAVQATGSDTTELLSNLYRALMYAVFARARTIGESLTRGEVDIYLKQNGADAETSARVSTLLGNLESARFGKTELSKTQQKALVSETSQLVKGLFR